MCVCLCVCLCVCACVSVCMCVCMCVWVALYAEGCGVRSAKCLVDMWLCINLVGAISLMCV